MLVRLIGDAQPGATRSKLYLLDAHGTTVFNRVNRWSQRGLWQDLFAVLVACEEPPRIAMVDSTSVRPSRRCGRQAGPEPGIGRRTDNQDPCDRRPAGSDRGSPADAGGGRRHHRCPHPARRDPRACRSDFRQGLRRRRFRDISHPARHPTGDLADAEPPRHPAIRRHRRPKAQPDRARVLQTQELAGDCHTLRQDRLQLPRRDLPRSRTHLVDQMRPQPSSTLAEMWVGRRFWDPFSRRCVTHRRSVSAGRPWPRRRTTGRQSSSDGWSPFSIGWATPSGDGCARSTWRV